MRTLKTLLALVPLAAAPALAQDPTVVDSNHYSVEFENDYVRVVRITYGPGEESVMHYHPDGVAVFLTDQRAQFTLPDGETVSVDATAGQVLWIEGGKHLPQNLADQPLELILVEMKMKHEEHEQHREH
jgi:quercetin dioxygenase-like cupin family protein